MQQTLRGRAFNEQTCSSPEFRVEAEHTRLRAGTDSFPSQTNGAIYNSPHARLDIHGRTVHLTQIINTGSGTVSGCNLSSAASA